ncbi:MAG: hypothetical protein HQL87_18880 [Magnetococcales bacterium]|nr:hypothetical protein [Magnetococcales bacterium]
MEDKQQKKSYVGRVVSKEDSYLFVQSSDLCQDVYAFFRHSDLETWQDISYNDDVSFNLGFTYKGAIAIEVRRLFANK